MTQMQTRTLPQTGTYVLDPAHTTIGFSARHLMTTRVRGTFREFEGRLEIGERPEDSSLEVVIKAASIDTRVQDRDNHLRSGDFLDVENHPEITFRSREIRSMGDNEFEVDGDLTIRGVTRPVTLDVVYLGSTIDPWGNEKYMATAETRIEREEWGLTWNQALEKGGWLVGKTVDLEIEVQASRA